MTTVDDSATIGRGGIDIAKSVGHAGGPRPVEHRISGFAVRHVRTIRAYGDASLR
ncbi:hypothetical protein R7S55_000728 [Raoultella ornithinolytica]|nr:hypothetical protein [Raoultella ornithinolytica]